jgi:hypothetical protein
MRTSSRILRTVLAPILLVAAILGYLIGAHHGAAASAAKRAAGRTQVAFAQSVILEYPGDWQQAKRPFAVPGLALAHPLSLVPIAEPGRAGLVTGELPADAQPLPAEFVTTLKSPPKTEVLNLLSVQAYRYSSITIARNGLTSVVYVVPTSGEHSIVLVCYAQDAGSPYLGECASIVATLSLVGQPGGELRPDEAYATHVDSVIKHLDRERVDLRRRLGDGASPDEVGGLADELAGGYNSAQASIATLEAPHAAAATQDALIHALKRGRDTYGELASAARDGDLVGYESARRDVEAAEDEVDLALEDYGLLGYGQPGQTGKS